MSEPKIIEVSENQRGQWIETKWSDGCITLHRRNAETISLQQENSSAKPNEPTEFKCILRRQPTDAYLAAKQIYDAAEIAAGATRKPSKAAHSRCVEDYKRAVEDFHKRESI